MSYEVRVTIAYEYVVDEDDLEKGYGIKSTETQHAIRSRIFSVDGHAENLLELVDEMGDVQIVMTVNGEVRSIDD